VSVMHRCRDRATANFLSRDLDCRQDASVVLVSGVVRRG